MDKFFRSVDAREFFSVDLKNRWRINQGIVKIANAALLLPSIGPKYNRANDLFEQPRQISCSALKLWKL